MAQRRFFSHVNLHGEDPGERGKKQGWNKIKRIDRDTWAVGLGENIFLNHLYDREITTTRNGIPVRKKFFWKTVEEIVQTTVQGWMNSPHHRQNILMPRYDRQGIGIAISGNDIYVTEDLF